MEKERGQIKFIETDDGFRVEVTGKSLKEAFSGCCLPIFGDCKPASECCPPSEEKK